MRKFVFAPLWPLLIVVSFYIVALYGVFFWCLLSGEQFGIFLWVIIIFFTLFLPTIILCSRLFAAVRIDTKGITQLLFGFIPMKRIRWDALKEIRFKQHAAAWVFFSKRPLGGLCYDKIVDRRDVIPVPYSEKVIHAIRCFSDQEIKEYKEE